jgi:hypothetical protein
MILGGTGAAQAAVEVVMTTMMNEPTVIRLMTPAEVAAAFRVDPKTVTRWAAAGKYRRTEA